MSGLSAADVAIMQRAACVAVCAAARLALRVQRTVVRPAASAEATAHVPVSVAKADASPVTIGDYGAQALVNLALRRFLPARLVEGFRMCAEEDAAALLAERALVDAVLEYVNAALGEVRQFQSEPPLTATQLGELIDAGKPWDRPGGCGYWVLDPIDGTKGFIRGGQWAVGLAYVENGAPRIAAIACPNLAHSHTHTHAHEGSEVGTVFMAEAGRGAFCATIAGLHSEDGGVFDAAAACASPVRIRVSELRATHMCDAVLAESVEAGHSNHAVTAAVRADLGMTAPSLRLDSMCKYALLSCGAAHVYVRVPPDGYAENVWDHMPGALLLTEAGGVVTDVHGQPLMYDTGAKLSRNRGIVAASAGLHPHVLDAVRRGLGL